jgi:hypothetical protein
MAQRILERASRRLEHQCTALTKKAVQRARGVLGPKEQTQVVFVAAAQRSGTTMMMDVLDRSLDTDVLYESDARAYQDFELRPADALEPVIAASPGDSVVLKALCELQDLRTLLDRFASARAIWMLRDYRDVVNSHLALWTGMPESIAKIAADRDSAGWRGRGMSDRTHRIVRRLYHPGISNASACALFWYFRNRIFFEQALEQDPRVMVVRYENLVGRPEEEFGRLFGFLGLPYTPRLSKGVFRTSVSKRPAPEIEPPIQALCEGLSNRFAAVLG